MIYVNIWNNVGGQLELTGQQPMLKTEFEEMNRNKDFSKLGTNSAVGVACPFLSCFFKQIIKHYYFQNCNMLKFTLPERNRLFATFSYFLALIFL